MNIKIYKIVDKENGNVYVGSTKQKYVCDRISKHRHPDNTCSSKQIIDNNNYYYELIEVCTDENRKERERYFINNTDNCININKLNGLNKEKKNLRDKLQMREKRAFLKSIDNIQYIDSEIFN